MRPPRSNAWRPPLVAMNCLDPPAAASAECATPRHLLLHQDPSPGAEPLLRGAQLRRLIGRQLEVLLHALAEALLDLRAQPPRFGGIALRAQAVALLGSKARRKQNGKTENYELLHLSLQRAQHSTKLVRIEFTEIRTALRDGNTDRKSTRLNSSH